MNIEYEATFTNVDKDKMRQRLKKAGAELVQPEFLQKRVTFNLPEKYHDEHSWLRVREEGDKITMSMKKVIGDKIADQKEICLKINDFKAGVEMLNQIGCRQKAYQENYRERWMLDGVEVTIDEWPFLDPFVEVEGASEAAVKAVSEKLSFDYSQALFCSITTLYANKYGLSHEIINEQTPRIVFDEPNPFLKE
jgi:adenylate cyclase, class 2